MSAVVEQKVKEFGAHSSPGSWFLSNESDIEKYPELLPYSHYLRQAWRELDLSGVLCVDARPAVYLCGGIEFTTQQKRQRHLFAWNQGLVPLLIFLTENQVEVHSTVKKPEKDSQQLFDLPSLVESLDNVATTLRAARLVRSIETGQFFQDKASFFPPKETVDRCLVENLVHTTRRLKDAGWDLPRAHALLGRALFVSFLHEREFIKPHYYPDGTASLLDILNSATVERQKHLLYREFFPRLKREFNGTMFDDALAKEEREVRKIHLDILHDFLSGHDMESGQMTLDFWAYDFSSIPVETISAIYEEFMKDSDLKKRRSEGAYYTPRHLAETTLHVALEDHYCKFASWRVLDPACGSGIFLVGMFNLLAEQWRRENSNRRRQTKAQALLNILQTQIRGVDVNPDACRITVFSLYLALFEKLRPIDVDEFKETVRYADFLPPLFWDETLPSQQLEAPVILCANFLGDGLNLEANFDLVIGNPPWDSRGDKQIGLHFAHRSAKFLRDGGIGCLLLPSTILVNRYGTLNGAWFRAVTVQRLVQLADFRRLLFKATHPCFIIRYTKTTPEPDHRIFYETPKLNRFESRTGIFVIEPDDQKLIPQHDVLEADLRDSLQTIWSRKFWGTPRDEVFLRRLDFFPRLSDLVGLRGKQKRWLGGTGFQPHFENRNYENYEPVDNPYRLNDAFLDAKERIDLVVFEDQFVTVGKKLRSLGASTAKVLFARTDQNFQSPMVIYNKGFTKHAFSNHAVKFFDGLRSITSEGEQDADLLRFLAATLGSRLFRYLAFHGGSNFGIGRDQLHVYESLALPFPLPTDELAPENANEIVREAARIVRDLEHEAKALSRDERTIVMRKAIAHLQPLIEAYFSVTDFENILIDDTITLFQPSIHRSNLKTKIPSLAFPEPDDRRRYAETLCDVLNRRARKQTIKISAQAHVSEPMNLILLTVVFAEERKPYRELSGEDSFWKALEKVSDAAKRKSGPFSYLRGFSYVERPNRLHLLKPATMRNWCRTAALNDADAIFEHLVTENA
ncbi:MAG TPA: N-6 DNA methylase [Pyrinomonadaceae bacterium]|nr:N-6 DNA methylase [Pyrinomonadaceae bacterium]